MPLAFITILVVYKHHNNITRLLDGTESKINFSPVHNTPTGITNETIESGAKLWKAARQSLKQLLKRK